MRNDIIEKRKDILLMIENNESKANICKFLNCKPETLNSYLNKLNIEYSGNKGLKGKKISSNRVSVFDYIEKDFVATSKLRKLLIRDGVKEKKCESCGLEEWMGKPIPLELHHIDENRFNNRLENLKILCSNCHMQEHNYSNTTKLTKVKDKLNNIKEMKTCQCGSQINLRSTMCEKCWSIKNRKVERPPFNQLLNEVTEMGYSGTGRKYGVSDNTIRKWLTSFNG
jgi:5-methylcytosine-specific restriction endonuclease McrA